MLDLVSSIGEARFHEAIPMHIQRLCGIPNARINPSFAWLMPENDGVSTAAPLVCRDDGTTQRHGIVCVFDQYRQRWNQLQQMYDDDLKTMNVFYTVFFFSHGRQASCRVDPLLVSSSKRPARALYRISRPHLKRKKKRLSIASILSAPMSNPS